MFAPGCLANSTNSLRSNMTDHSFHGMPFLLEVCMPLSECYPCLRTVLPMSPVHTQLRRGCWAEGPAGVVADSAQTLRFGDSNDFRTTLAAAGGCCEPLLIQGEPSSSLWVPPRGVNQKKICTIRSN